MTRRQRPHAPQAIPAQPVSLRGVASRPAPLRGVLAAEPASLRGVASRPAPLRGVLAAAQPASLRAVLAAAAARVESFLLEPADPAGASPEPPAAVPPRPVVAVFGLARRCGATVVARALAAELAGRDPAGTAAVASGRAGGGIPLATPAAGRLAESLGDVPGATPTAVGRLCLVEGAEPPVLAEVARHHAPLVLDAGASPIEGAAATVADRLVLVSAPSVEPALARVAAACARRLDREPLIVLNRAASDAPGPSEFELPDSRMGAQLALGGRLARGDLGRAVATLADRCEVGR